LTLRCWCDFPYNDQLQIKVDWLFIVAAENVTESVDILIASYL